MKESFQLTQHFNIFYKRENTRRHISTGLPKSAFLLTLMTASFIFFYGTITNWPPWDEVFVDWVEAIQVKEAMGKMKEDFL